MNQEISGTLLLDPKVIEDPYPFYRQLLSHAPVWRVPGTKVFVASSFALLAEAAGRVEDFSSNMPCLLYRDENGLPSRLPFGDSAIPALATADPPLHTLHRTTVFPNFVANRMALLEARVVLRVLLEHTSSITLDPDQPPLWVDSLMVRRHEPLPMQLVPRA